MFFIGSEKKIILVTEIQHILDTIEDDLSGAVGKGLLAMQKVAGSIHASGRTFLRSVDICSERVSAIETPKRNDTTPSSSLGSMILFPSTF